MRKLLRITPFAFVLALFGNSLLIQAQAQEFPSMPADIEAELRDIGARVEGQRTTALYEQLPATLAMVLTSAKSPPDSPFYDNLMNWALF